MILPSIPTSIVEHTITPDNYIARGNSVSGPRILLLVRQVREPMWEQISTYGDDAPLLGWQHGNRRFIQLCCNLL